MEYKDVTVRLSREGSHRYLASVLEDDKPVASHSFELRTDELKIMQRLWELEEAALSPKSEETFHIDFGRDLYQKVLAGELGRYLQGLLDDADEGLRISLQFDDDIPELAVLPWEFLHDGDDFLVARRDILISRMPSKARKVQSRPLESILRMLVIISAPEDPSCGPLNAEREREKILEAVDKLYVEHKIEVDFTDDATFETIQSYLNEKDYHIVHFTGHGKETDGQGYLVLEGEDGRARRVDNQTISDLFAGRGIRLVVLSACESADLATKLVRKMIPAVLAMQYKILDASATNFASSFFQALASGKAVDLSLTEARLAMRNTEDANGVDFATPVLNLLDPHCMDLGLIKPAPTELFQKPVMLGEVQVMKTGFVGRQRELRTLQKAFISDVKRAAIIYGFGGIGKTVLATRLALRMNQYFEGVYGFKCQPGTRPEDILKGLNAFLNLAGILALNQVLFQPVPLQAKTASLVSILNQRRFLIILDNFESCLDESRIHIADPALKEFIEHLLNATITNTKYVITTRYDFDPMEGRLTQGIEHLPVPEMPFYQAVWLMNSHAELAKLGLRKKEKIFKNIGGHPWTIGMFARHAATATVDGLLLELEPLKRELKEFTLFDKSYSMLDEDSRELLLRSSVFEEAVPIEALSWIMGDEARPSLPVDMPLEKLLRWGLISRQEGAEEMLYSVHTLVRDFVGKEAEAQKAKEKMLLIRAAQYYENEAKTKRNLWDHLQARSYYYRSGELVKAADIVFATWEYLARWGYIELAMSLLQQSADTTTGTIQAIATGNLATLYLGVGDWMAALKLHERVERIFEEEGDRRNVAASLHQLGMIHQRQGNYSEAVKLYQQSLDILKELGDKAGIASSQHQLGNIHQRQGNYSEAVKLYQQSLNIKKELGDKAGVATSLHQLGMINQDHGNYSEAVKLYQQSLDILKELGDKAGVASSLHQLGTIYENDRNYQRALDNYIKAQSIFEDLKDPNLEIVERSLNRLKGKMGKTPLEKLWIFLRRSQ